MDYNNLNMLDMFMMKESQIKTKYDEIQRLYKDREELRKGCSDNIVVCVSKYPYYMGKDLFCNEKNICLICGKEVNHVKKDTVVVDMSDYVTGLSDSKEDIEYKLLYVREIYKGIIKKDFNINKDTLIGKLNRAIVKNDNEKVLEKKMN